VEEEALRNELSEVYLIFDPNFGNKIDDLPTGVPAWIVMSDENEVFIRRFWAANPDRDWEHGITGFSKLADADAETQFASQLENIEKHHGPYSEAPPFTTLKVLGMRLTEQARQQLLFLGFAEFSESHDGFTATRTEQEARVRRYDRARWLGDHNA
jgi:hypothetical protein